MNYKNKIKFCPKIDPYKLIQLAFFNSGPNWIDPTLAFIYFNIIKIK